MSLADLMGAIVGAVTDIVPPGTIALFISAGSVITLSGVLLKRFIKAGK